MKLQIQVQAEGGAAGQHFEIPFDGDAIVLGRGPESPVPLEGSKLSRNHVAFGLANGALTLTDLSSNGVWLNAQPIPKKTAVGLQGNEEIAIPGYRMRVRLLSPPPVVAPPAPTIVTKVPEIPATAIAVATRQEIPPAERSAGTAEILLDDRPGEPPWWQPSTMDRLVLLFIALAIALAAYYYSLQ